MREKPNQRARNLHQPADLRQREFGPSRTIQDTAHNKGTNGLAAIGRNRDKQHATFIISGGRRGGDGTNKSEHHGRRMREMIGIGGLRGITGDSRVCKSGTSQIQILTERIDMTRSGKRWGTGAYGTRV